MPFPLNLEEMEHSGYTFLRSESCPECLENVEVFLTPGKREIVMNPMCEALRPAVRHLEVCKPIPASKELLLKAAYTLIERIVCPHCQRAVDMYDTPSGASIILNPMMGADWPVVHHRCNIAPKQEEPSGRRQSTGAARVAGNEGGGSGGTTICTGARVHVGNQQENGGEVQDAARRVRDGGSGRNSGGGVAGFDLREQNLQSDKRGNVSMGGRDDGSSIKLHAVRDPNYQLLAVGWQDGTLICQFKTAKWSYEGVPEAEFNKLTRSPFAYRIFTTNIKGKFKGTKIG